MRRENTLIARKNISTFKNLKNEYITDDRSSHQRCSIKKSVLRNFAKFTGKHLCQSFYFNKVVGLRPATLFNKRLWYSCFPVNSAKFLRTSFYRTPLTTASVMSRVCGNIENTKEENVLKLSLKELLFLTKLNFQL